MSDSNITLPVIAPNERPHVDIHYEWTQFPLWLNGRYGIDSIAGHEIGLSSELVRDLLAWSDAADAQFEADDPANSAAPANFLEDGFELAKRVRAELSAEWIVTSYDPRAKRKVELIIDD